MLRSKASLECSSELAPLGNISGSLRGKGRACKRQQCGESVRLVRSGCLPFASASLRSKLIVTMLRCNAKLGIISRNRPRSRGAALRGLLGIVAAPHTRNGVLPRFSAPPCSLGWLLARKPSPACRTCPYSNTVTNGLLVASVARVYRKCETVRAGALWLIVRHLAAICASCTSLVSPRQSGGRLKSRYRVSPREHQALASPDVHTPLYKLG